MKPDQLFHFKKRTQMEKYLYLSLIVYSIFKGISLSVMLNNSAYGKYK